MTQKVKQQRKIATINGVNFQKEIHPLSTPEEIGDIIRKNIYKRLPQEVWN